MKVRAKNAFGWSDFSEILVIKAATWPEIAKPVVTSIDSSTGDVLLSWTAPYHNEQTITKY